jgi:hypothetical protein
VLPADLRDCTGGTKVVERSEPHQSVRCSIYIAEQGVIKLATRICRCASSGSSGLALEDNAKEHARAQQVRWAGYVHPRVKNHPLR